MANKGSHGNQELSLRDELEQVSGMIAHLSKRAVDEGQDKVSEEIANLKAAADELKKRTNTRAHATFETASAQVKENPMSSLLGAFTAGAIVAALLSRR